MAVTREERELRLALRGTARVAEREAREELDMRLALEESGQDNWWSQLPLQLCWLRRPDSLQLLMQQPVWLDAWRRGEEKRAALLWGKLPDTVIKIVLELDFHELQMRRQLAEQVCRQWIHVHCCNCRRVSMMDQAELMVAEAMQRAIEAEADSAQQCVCQ